MTVAEELHFSHAAEKLFIAQPSLSRQIKQLEDELGVILLERTKRTVTLTEAGQYFYKEVQNIFFKIDHVKKQAQHIQSGTVGKVKLAYVPSAMHNILPRFIAKLQQNVPDLNLELYQMTAVTQYEMLKTEKLDVAFLRIPYNDEEIESEVVFTETYSLVIPENHKIGQSNFKGLQQFAKENFILTPRSVGERYFDNIISLCTAAGFSPKIAHESVSEHATIKLVENNIGVSIIPTSFKDGFNAKVKFIELKDVNERLQLSMAWKKTNTNPSLLMMIKMMKDAIL